MGGGRARCRACDARIDETIDYMRERKMFGQPVLDNQYVHFRLAELKTEVEALRALTYRAVRDVRRRRGRHRARLDGQAQGRPPAREVSDACLQYWGGMGYTWDNPVSRAYRDGRLGSIGGGADEVMLGIICKYMGILPEAREDPRPRVFRSNLLIANRGEIALRVMRTARAHGPAHGGGVLGRRPRRAARARGRRRGAHRRRRAARFLPEHRRDHRCRRRAGADAVHPGYGFLSENADFAEPCIEAGLVWVGPPPAAMRALGDKANAKRRMRRRAACRAVPVAAARYERQKPELPADDQGDRRRRRARHAARALRRSELRRSARIGAIRSRSTPSATARCCWNARSIAPRHVEVQVFADTHGNCIHLGERDCSVQRRHQKLIEEVALARAWTRSCARRMGAGGDRGWRARSATSAPARSSSCSTPTASSGSWR